MQYQLRLPICMLVLRWRYGRSFSGLILRQQAKSRRVLATLKGVVSWRV
ncbi:MAG: hypothetical protein H0X34_15280 [Chthoniobacterales bacterium]|nr:hypothetical protein [Chthoniobacterales bacterium]